MNWVILNSSGIGMTLLGAFVLKSEAYLAVGLGLCCMALASVLRDKEPRK